PEAVHSLSGSPRPRQSGPHVVHPPQLSYSPCAARYPGQAREGCPMTSLPQARLDALMSRYQAVEDQLAAGPDRDSYVKLSGEFSELGPVVEAVKGLRATTAELNDVEALLADASTDSEMRALAQSEKPVLEERRTALEHQIRLALIPKDAMD